MTTLKTAVDLVPVINATAYDVDNWVDRLEMVTEFRPTGRGRARVFDRWNARELGLLSGFVRAGMKPSEAVAYNRGLIQTLRNRRPVVEWLAFPAGDPSSSRGFAEPPTLDRLAELYPGAIGFAIIRPAEIIRRVDALFEEAA